MSVKNASLVRAIRFEELQKAGRMALQLEGQSIVLFAYKDQVYALDNRCPHMGFPLDRGSLKEGILTCHWHHARFDLESGGTFDQWADDVRAFPVEIRDGEVWVDLAGRADLYRHNRERLRAGLERDLPLVIGKAVLVLLEVDGDPVEPFRTGLEFGARYRRGGWGQGLTMLTCLMNILTFLDAADRPRALYHGLSAVSENSAGSPPRFLVHPLPGEPPRLPTLKRWFRRFVEVRDAEGAERCLASAIRAGAGDREMADMLFTAATDHRYIQIGHVADFTNKAFEALDIAGWDFAELILTSLVPAYAGATRMEESNSWRNPVDLVEILETAFERLPAALQSGQEKDSDSQPAWKFQDELIQVLLGEDPQAIVDALLQALRDGARAAGLASAVSYAAALRIARFHTSNEFSDWDTCLHTFTFANAIEQAVRRAPSVELMRGVFDAAMSIYLDRFLNIPAARLPQVRTDVTEVEGSLKELAALLDRQQQVNQAAGLVAGFLAADGSPGRLLATLGKLLLREDRDFHTIQALEAAFQQHLLQGDPQARTHVLVAATRYLAAHSPTVRSQGQTYDIAYRLHRGERLYEED